MGMSIIEAAKKLLSRLLETSADTFEFINDDDVEVTVEYDYTPACRGARDSFNGRPGAGLPLEPDEPESVDILDTYDQDGNGVTLSPSEEQRAKEQILDQVHSSQDHDE
jgi:hypothetical protein